MKSFLTIALLLLTIGIYGQDIEGASDYYLFNRMPDFEISKYEQIEFEALDVYDGKEKFTVEGKKFIIEYSHKNRSVTNATFPSRLQVLRNYSNAIQKAGGQIVFERHNAEYGYYSFIGENQKEV